MHVGKSSFSVNIFLTVQDLLLEAYVFTKNTGDILSWSHAGACMVASVPNGSTIHTLVYPVCMGEDSCRPVIYTCWQ